jgi:membrane protein implicated in regulation of membrane protease activity
MKNIRFTDAVLILLGIGTVLFIVRTFDVFVLVGSEPSALVAGFFSFVTAEAAILWRIYESKHKRKDGETKQTGESQPDEWELDIDADPNEVSDDGGNG